MPFTPAESLWDFSATFRRPDLPVVTGDLQRGYRVRRIARKGSYYTSLRRGDSRESLSRMVVVNHRRESSSRITTVRGGQQWPSNSSAVSVVKPSVRPANCGSIKNQTTRVPASSLIAAANQRRPRDDFARVAENSGTVSRPSFFLRYKHRTRIQSQ